MLSLEGLVVSQRYEKARYFVLIFFAVFLLTSSVELKVNEMISTPALLMA